MEKIRNGHAEESRAQWITLLDTSSRLDNGGAKEKLGRRAIKLSHERIKLRKFFPHNMEKVVTPHSVKVIKLQKDPG